MSVELIETTTEELVEAMAQLIPQLSTSTPTLSHSEVEEFVDQPGVHLFIYRPDTADEDGKTPILGILSLATFRIPTGLRAWIEDVVVDGAARGQGAGQKLVEEAVAYAQMVGARTVDLTSRPTREAANRLYVRCGFDLRETNVYRYATK